MGSSWNWYIFFCIHLESSGWIPATGSDFVKVCKLLTAISTNNVDVVPRLKLRGITVVVQPTSKARREANRSQGNHRLVLWQNCCSISACKDVLKAQSYSQCCTKYKKQCQHYFTGNTDLVLGPLGGLSYKLEIVGYISSHQQLLKLVTVLKYCYRLL